MKNISESDNNDVDEDIELVSELSKIPTITSRKDCIKMTIPKLFARYNNTTREQNPEAKKDEIKEDGLLQFSRDLGIPAADASFLVLFSKFNCKEQYVITKREFIEGFKSLHLDNLEQIKNALPKLRKELKEKDPNTNEMKKFLEVYDYSFHYNCGEENNFLDITTAMNIWESLFKAANLKYSGWEDFKEFCTEEYFKVRDVNIDVWIEVLNISLNLKDFGKRKRTKDNYNNFIKQYPILGNSKIFKEYLSYLKEKKKFFVEKSIFS